MSKTLTVTNVAGIRGTVEIELRPAGELTIIAGANGAGKSSVINAANELLSSKGVKLLPKPIHEGADEAYAEFVDEELGLRIAKRWKQDGPGKLEVTAISVPRRSWRD